MVAVMLLSVQAPGVEIGGHSTVAELAQRRLALRPAAEVERLLEPGHSLASIASQVDDVRDDRPETYRWMALRRLGDGRG